MKRMALISAGIALISALLHGKTALAQPGVDVIAVADGSWVDGSTWDTATAPTGQDDGEISGNYTVTIADGDLAQAFRTILGQVEDGTTGTLTMTGGTLETDAVFAIGGSAGLPNANGTGIFNQSGGTVSVGALNPNAGFEGVTLGGRAGQMGFYNMSGGTLSAPEDLNLGVSDGAVGTIVQTAGDITTGALTIGHNETGTGVYTMSGGTLTVSEATGNSDASGDLFVAQSGSTTGTFSLSGDAAVDVRDDLVVGQTGGDATISITGSMVSISAIDSLFASSSTALFNFLPDVGGVSTINLGGGANVDGAVFDIIESSTVAPGTVFDLVSSFEGVSGAASLGPNAVGYVLQLDGTGNVLQAMKIPEPSSLATVILCGLLAAAGPRRIPSREA